MSSLSALSETKPATPLPDDVLTHIIHDATSTYRIDVDSFEYDEYDHAWFGNLHKPFIEERGLLCNAALVSRQWNTAASRTLYRGMIYIDPKIASLRLLLRTLQGNVQLAQMVQHLYLESPLGSDATKLDDYTKIATSVMQICTNICRLDGSFYFPKDVQFPIFTRLQYLSVWNQALYSLAPIFQYTPNLVSFNSLYLTSSGSWKLPEGLGKDLEAIPAPSFSLRKLRLSQPKLTLEQIKWFLGSSTQLEYVELQDTWEHSDDIGRVIGPYVKHLHLKGTVERPQKGSRELSESVHHYTALKTLQVSGRDWHWRRMLNDVKASLETLRITYSTRGCPVVHSLLSNKDWQPGLHELVVRHRAESDYFYGVRTQDVTRDRELLEKDCKARSTDLRWITIGESSAEIDGPYAFTEDEFHNSDDDSQYSD